MQVSISQSKVYVMYIIRMTFVKWLDMELQVRGWTRAELSRRANISQAALSHIYSGNRKPGADVCESIANALRLPPDQVFRAAGILPQTTDDPWVDEQAYRLQKLSGPRRSMAERLLKSLEDEEIQAAQEDEAGNRKLKPVTK